MQNTTDQHCVSLRIPADAEYIDIVRLTLYGLANKAGFSYEEIEDMKVAVSEACNNAVLHAYEGGKPDQSVEIRFETGDDRFTITVKDEGKSFDYEQVVERSDSLHSKTLDQIHAGGLGIFMMQALMDDVQVRSGAGTEVILTKLLHKSGEPA